MTPKEKAKELFNKYSSYVAEKDFFGDNVEKSNAQLCAIIAVDEIVKIFESKMPPLTANYWKQVREEIKNL